MRETCADRKKEKKEKGGAERGKQRKEEERMGEREPDRGAKMNMGLDGPQTVRNLDRQDLLLSSFSFLLLSLAASQIKYNQ